MKKPNEAALLHLFKGALEARLKDLEIPPGHHDCSRMEMTLTAPDFAAVDRAEGSAGEGYDTGKPSLLEVTFGDVCLLLDRAGIEVSDLMWAECIRERLKGVTKELPPAAIAGLAIVQAEQPLADPVNRKTPSKRTGEKGVEVKYKRLAKAAVAAS